MAASRGGIGRGCDHNVAPGHIVFRGIAGRVPSRARLRATHGEARIHHETRMAIYPDGCIGAVANRLSRSVSFRAVPASGLGLTRVRTFRCANRPKPTCDRQSIATVIPIWVPAFAGTTRRDSSLLQPCLILPAARWRPGFARLPPRSKVRGVAERRAAHRPDPRLATRARLAQRARLAALHRGVPVRPASAGLIPTNPGPRFTAGISACQLASSSRTGRSAGRA
jgi:hypothetical protein